MRYRTRQLSCVFAFLFALSLVGMGLWATGSLLAKTTWPGTRYAPKYRELAFLRLPPGVSADFAQQTLGAPIVKRKSLHTDLRLELVAGIVVYYNFIFNESSMMPSFMGVARNRVGMDFPVYLPIQVVMSPPVEVWAYSEPKWVNYEVRSLVVDTELGLVIGKESFTFYE